MKLADENAKAFSKLSALKAYPEYDRASLKSGIVHIGVGGFHRAHQAYYIQNLLQLGGSKDWAICGVGLMEADRRVCDALEQQDGLYTLVNRYADGDVSAEVIGSVIEVMLAPDNPASVINKLAAAETKLVTLTITEGGYNFHPETEEFNFDDDKVRHDLAHPDTPISVFGFITAALTKRKEKGVRGFTILSCDNVQKNGDVAKKVFLDFAQRQQPENLSWFEQNVSFPNSMVDRITPSTSETTLDFVENKLGIVDQVPVNSEPYSEWVIEDDFILGRPSLEQVGVKFVADVAPYEEMKLRVLNAGHSLLGIAGALCGYETIDQCANDDILQKYLRAYWDHEVTPVLSLCENTDVEHYKNTVAERFKNVYIKDTVDRICSESSAKLPKFVIPTITNNLAGSGQIKLSALLIALWCFYCDKQINEFGGHIAMSDDRGDLLATSAQGSSDNPTSFLELEEVFGSLASCERFVKVYKEYLESLNTGSNVRQTIAAAIA